jgi:pilus assembly protein CpaC
MSAGFWQAGNLRHGVTCMKYTTPLWADKHCQRGEGYLTFLSNLVLGWVSHPPGTSLRRGERMHQTISLPGRLARTWGSSLVLGLLVGTLAQTASAQGTVGSPLDRQTAGFGQQFKELGDLKDAKGATPYVIEMTKDTTRRVEMSTKELIAEVRSENPNVVRVQALLDNPRAVLVTGVAAGITRVFITDVKKNTESFDVSVRELNDEDVRWEQQARYVRESLQKAIREAVPTSSVEVRPLRNGKILLTGNVPNAESLQTILELARSASAYRDPNQAAQTRSGAIPAEKDSVINALRIGGVQQVQIEVTIARVNRSKARNIGFSFYQTGQQHYLASTVAGPGSVAQGSVLTSILSPAATLPASPNAVFGIFNDKEGFFGYLTALTTEGLAKLIAEPRVITQSGRPAWIVSGGETPILTTSGTGAPSVTYKTFGTIVNFLPVVLGNGKIHLEVRPEISAIDDAAGISIPSAVGTTKVPGFDLRSAQVAVEMEDGQTLAIGGLIQNTINATNNKVPILGDIPFLAFAFSGKTYTETEEELIILVTPHLVDPMACTQLPKYLPGRETRTPDDFELFLEGILEAPRGQRNLTHPYTAAYVNGRSATVFPCGDASGCGDRNGGKGCATGQCTPNGGGTAPAANPPKTDVRPVSDTVDAFNPAAAPMSIRDPVPVAPVGAGSVPTLPPVTNPGTTSETRLAPAVFGPAVLTDR